MDQDLYIVVSTSFFIAKMYCGATLCKPSKHRFNLPEKLLTYCRVENSLKLFFFIYIQTETFKISTSIKLPLYKSVHVHIVCSTVEYSLDKDDTGILFVAWFVPSGYWTSNEWGIFASVFESTGNNINWLPLRRRNESYSTVICNVINMNAALEHTYTEQ